VRACGWGGCRQQSLDLAGADDHYEFEFVVNIIFERDTCKPKSAFLRIQRIDFADTMSEEVKAQLQQRFSGGDVIIS
jgi:hypothetical protein